MALETTILVSVGSVITPDGIVYPLMVNNHPDLHNGTPVSECTDEWYDSLSEEDYNLVMERGETNNLEADDVCPHGNSWSSNCSECDEYTDEELAELEFIGKFESGSLDYLDL